MKQPIYNTNKTNPDLYLLQTNHFSALHLVSSHLASVLLSWRQFWAVPPAVPLAELLHQAV